MHKLATLISLAALLANTSVLAAPADILDGNKAAMGGTGWDGKATFSGEYAYSGQGLTGKVVSLADLAHGFWTDSISAGPASFANGFDGDHAWEKDPSGTVTLQDGGEQRSLAVNEGYRRANLWWRADRGGATITDDARKMEGKATFDVLTVTPNGGTKFDAWFDEKTHLLTRVVEKHGWQIFTTTYSDYATEDGADVARKMLISSGDPKYDQTLTLTKADFGAALARDAFSAPRITVEDFGISGGEETTFPFHLYNNHIYADAKVNGKGPYQFIFDTGGENFVATAVAKELGLDIHGHFEGSGAGSGHMDVSMAKVASLELGRANVKNQIFAVVPIGAMAIVEGVGMPGMVGFETFRRFVTRIDYGKGTITLIMPDAFDARDAGEAIPFVFDGSTIEVSALYGGIKGNFTVDTGSRASLTLNTAFVAKNKLNDGKTVDSVNGWGIGGPTRGYAMRGKTLQIGSLAVARPVTELSTDRGGAFADESMSGNIGAGVLKRYVVTLDYGHQVIYLQPVAGPVADLDTYDRAGMWINMSNAGFEIVDVTSGAPADKAGLKAGDQIIAVDGRPAASIKLYDLRQRLRDEAPGTLVIFSVRRGSETKEARVTLRDLI